MNRVDVVPEVQRGLAKLATRIEKTFYARLKMAQRLQSRGIYWTGALVGLAVASTVASIGLLFNPSLYGLQGEVLLTLVGVCTLVASLTVASADYASRARRAFEIYRRFQRLSVVAKEAARHAREGSRKQRATYADLDGRYQDILDESDNHSGADYARSIRFSIESPKSHTRSPSGGPLSSKRWRDPARFEMVSRAEFFLRWGQMFGSALITSLPVFLLVGATAFVVPTVLWIVSGFAH